MDKISTNIRYGSKRKILSDDTCVINGIIKTDRRITY